jgi:signal transduction histidine kinase
MELSGQDLADEIKRLQRCINDLISVLALPAIWTGGEPSQIVHTLLECLIGMLRLDFVYFRLNHTVGDVPAEIMRAAEARLPASTQHEIRESLNAQGSDPESWPLFIPGVTGGGKIFIVPMLLGLQGQIGLLVAGSQRRDFPRDTEKLLLGVAANQAAIGLQEAQLLSEQKKIAHELDQRVEKRTRELADANKELKREMLERKLSEEALAKARSDLAKITRITSLGVLTASIAHEVNQPLSGIITNASTCLRMLSADPPNVDGARETARRTIRDGNRASDVITRLRTLYSKKDIAPEPMDLNDATREVIALLMSELHRNRIILQCELAADLPLINGDRIQLQQVILNLVRNASDAMSTLDDRPRHLFIRTQRDEEGHARLTVQDAGVGFALEDEAKLFEAFFTTKDDGMGIGLSVSRSIIEAHHGRLWATTNHGSGSTFSFTIPHDTSAVA